MNKNRAFNLLKKMEFTRIGGTAEELKCANMLADEIKKSGLTPSIEPFAVNSQTITKAKLIADGQEYPCVAYGNCGSTPKEGLTAEFYYLENFADIAVAKLRSKGKIVLTNGYMGIDSYKKLIECGAVGFVTFGGDVLDKQAQTDLMTRELRQPLKDVAVLQGVNIRAASAMKLVKQNPKNITLIVEQKEEQVNSHNVVAKIKGDLDETIVFTAHYDSVDFSKGVYDNGAGSVIIMELFHYFCEHTPRRNLVFIWCGSEERGLLGSKAYVQQHKDELDKYVLCVNVDVGAPVLGREEAVVMADVSLANYVDYFAKEIGHTIRVTSDIYSSDSIPFADAGVPGINFMRNGASGCSHIHDRFDTMKFLSAEALAKTGEFTQLVANKLVNAFAFPVPKAIPDDIKTKIDKYLGKEVKK
ncbi:MAG: M28 family metallopeptidase [Clostridia bacterium]